MQTIRVLLIAAIVPFSGCLAIFAPHRENTKMASLRGVEITRVIAAWGLPTSRDGNVYQWAWNGHPTMTGVTAWQDRCREWFEMDDAGRITSGHWQGSC